MTYKRYNLKDNYYEVSKGFYKKYKRFIEEKVNEEVVILRDEKNITGIRIYNIFSKNEINGALAEQYIKDFFDKNNLPCLYIGQGPTGTEYSNVFKKQLEAHRPDFLVHLPDIGTIFLDVKARSLRGFEEQNEKYFSLNYDEVEGLLNLQQQLLMPVWIAFINNQIDIEKQQTFFMLSCSKLKLFYSGLLKSLNPRERELIKSIRIPWELLQETKNELALPIGITPINDKIISEFTQKYQALFEKIEDIVISHIDEHDTTKKDVSSEIVFKITKMSFLLNKEVDSVVDTLIKEKRIIISNTNDFLKLPKEIN